MMVDTHQAEPVAAETSAQARVPRPERFWRLAGFGLALAVGLVFFLPSAYALVVLLGLLLVGIVVIARDADATPRTMLRDTRAALRVLSFRTGMDVTRRRAMSQGFGIAACVLMAFAAIGFRPSSEDAPLTAPVVPALLGALALGLSLRFAPAAPLSILPSEHPLVPARPKLAWTLAGIVPLVLVGLINVAKGSKFAPAQLVSLHVEFVLFAAGVSLVVWGLAGAPRVDWASVRAQLRQRHIVILFAIFLIALVVRVWQLGSALRFSVDEAIMLEGVGHAWGNRDAGLVSQVSNYLPISQMYAYWQTLAIGVFGRSADGLRMTSAIIGALTVFAVYLLARGLFDKPTGLIAAFLLATFPPHVHFSRIGMMHMGDPLFGTLALALAVRGLRDNRRLDWALAGACLGMTQFFFEAGRLLYPPLVIGALGLLGLRYGRRLRHHWRGMVVGLLALLFTIAPLYFSLFALDKPRASRLADSGISPGYFQSLTQGGVTGPELEGLLHRLTFPLQIFVHQPEIGLFYGGHQALVLEYLVPVFLLGVAFLLWRLRTPAVVLLLWLLLVVLGNTLLRDMAVYARYVVATPAITAIMALALRTITPLVWPRRGMALIPIAALTLLIGLAQVNYYFNEHLPVYRDQLRNSTAYDGMDAVLRAADLPTTAQVILISDPPYDGEVGRVWDSFLSRRGYETRLQTLPAAQVTPEYLAGLPHDHDYAFFVAPGSESVLALLSTRFQLDPPQASPDPDVPDAKAFILYYARPLDGVG